MAFACPLYSGSSGNSFYLGNRETGGILVDVGVSFRKISAALQTIGTSADKIKGILITHEHADHIAGLSVFLRKFPVPVYASEGTMHALRVNRILPEEVTEVIMNPEEEYILEEFSLSSFKTLHDTPDSTGFVMCYGEQKFGVATDLGEVTDDVRGSLIGSDYVLLEANYDEHLLKTGNYPNFLKQRVAGRRGHLSNTAAGAFAAELVATGTTRLSLGHLSQNNNTPDHAFQAVTAALLAAGAIQKKDYLIETAKRDLPSEGMLF